MRDTKSLESFLKKIETQAKEKTVFRHLKKEILNHNDTYLKGLSDLDSRMNETPKFFSLIFFFQL